jgi:hypothetical protein
MTLITKMIFTEFEVKFPNSSVPRRETMYRLVKKFEKHDSVVMFWPFSNSSRTNNDVLNVRCASPAYL